MGAVNFSIDLGLVDVLKEALPLDVFVETGTFKGETVELVKDCFLEIHTIEFSPEYFEEARARFAGQSHIELIQGDSAAVLAALAPGLRDRSVLYFLDAHWCAATGTAGEAPQCPLLEELQAIGKLNDQSVILIDDARLFLGFPLSPHDISRWPRFHKIVSSLLSISAEHELAVVNDVIAFYPKSARAAVESYAQNYGVDWLSVVNSLKQCGSLVQQLEEKERVIQEQERAIQGKERVIQEQERAIRDLDDALQSYTAFFSIPIIGQFLRVGKRIWSILRPRLGNFHQYAPRPLTAQAFSTVGELSAAVPRISIVTPSFQQGGYIERTLKSVLEQGYPNLEYFVQDGGSSDQTVAVLKTCEQQLSGWCSERDSGQSQAINLGFANTSGEIMAWLNSDDLLLPGALACVADYFVKHQEVDVFYGNRVLIDENDMEIGRWILPGHDDKVLSWADYVPQETLFWRRSIWEKVGGKIDESFRFAMDWDLLVRFRDAGARFAHIPHFLGAFRVHAHQKTSAAISKAGFQEMDRIRERVHGYVPSRKEVRRAVMPFLARHIAADMAYRIKTRIGPRPAARTD